MSHSKYPRQQNLVPELSRRGFLHGIGGFGAAMGLGALGAHAAEDGIPRDKDGNIVPGFEKGQDGRQSKNAWEPFSDRKVKVGIAGHGFCRFGAQFGFQDHPNVEVIAVTDLIEENRNQLARACRCTKTYPSCEEMLGDKDIEAVFIATDAPSHARLAIMAAEHEIGRAHV